jgi:putative transposase
METRYSAQGCYRHENHIVWIPKYRKSVLIRGIKTYVERNFKVYPKYRPEISIVQYNIQPDHVHLIIIIPPKYAVSKIVGELKANSSRSIRQRFPWIKQTYRENVFWSPGFFSSTIGLNEEEIQRYIKYQEKLDKETIQLKLDLF